MAKLLGLAIAASLFSLTPAVLLFFQYNLAVSLAYLAISLTQLSIFWGVNDIRDEVRQIADHRGGPVVADTRRAS